MTTELLVNQIAGAISRKFPIIALSSLVRRAGSRSLALAAISFAVGSSQKNGLGRRQEKVSSGRATSPIGALFHNIEKASPLFHDAVA